MTMQPHNIEQCLMAIDSLVLFRNIFEDPVLARFKRMLIDFRQGRRSLHRLYYSLLGDLIGLETEQRLVGIDLFKNHLLNSMLCRENPFSFNCEIKDYSELDGMLIEAAKRDLVILKKIYDFNLSEMEKFLRAGLEGLIGSVNFTGIETGETGNLWYPQTYYKKMSKIKSAFASSLAWDKHVEDLHFFFHSAGSGIYGSFWAFKWECLNGKQGLVGVPRPDPIRLEDLVGCDNQIEEIVRNTKQFIHGHGANNVLLYGDRGSGKSSTVKSLLHIFGEQALRIVEITKHDLLWLPQVVATVENRALKFIIFIDDLSFEEDETEYKELKALLEGSIAKPPDNVLVYATSNRRNIVREYFNDRATDEVGSQDTYQEKLSLADRFGIKLVYSVLDKEGYLQTIDVLAGQSGIQMNRAELHGLALRWALWHNGRSGRTARQFINDLKGRLSI